MNYNYDELVDAAARRLQGSSANTPTKLNTLLKSFVNEAKDVLESDLRSQFGERPNTLTTVAAQEAYTLPPEYRWGGLNRVVVNGTEYELIDPELYDSGNYTNVCKLDTKGETIYLDPAPTAAGNDIDLYYQLDSPDLITGTASAGDTTYITLASTVPPVDDIYNGTLIEITGGTGEGQVAYITDYDGATYTATATFTTAPDNTSTYATIPPFPKRARRAIIEKAIELYRKRMKAFDDADIANKDYQAELYRAQKNNKNGLQKPRLIRINTNL